MKPTKVAGSNNTRARWGQKGFTLIEIMIVVLVTGVLLAIAVPSFVKARETSSTKTCVANLTQIQSAKQQWALETGKAETEVPNDDHLFGIDAYIRIKPACPASGTYDLEAVDTPPTCSIGGTHVKL